MGDSPAQSRMKTSEEQDNSGVLIQPKIETVTEISYPEKIENGHT